MTTTESEIKTGRMAPFAEGRRRVGLDPSLRSAVVTVMEIVRRARKLPSPPAALTRQLDIIGKQDYDAGELAHAIELDPGLSSAVLELANRYVGSDVRIDSIRRAIATVGERRLLQLVFAQATSANAEVDVPAYEKERGELWRHSVRLAICAEQVARRTPDCDSSQAYAIGLLMDCAKLAMGPHLAPLLEDASTLAAESPGMGLDAIEKCLMGIDHAEMSARLAHSWGLPAMTTEAIRYHHRPGSAPNAKPLAYAVHVADMLASEGGGAGGVAGLTYKVDPLWSLWAPLTADEIEEIGEAVQQSFGEAMEFLG